jgi:hypothetical protein
VEVKKFFAGARMPDNLESLARGARCPKTGVLAEEDRLFLLKA